MPSSEGPIAGRAAGSRGRAAFIPGVLFAVAAFACPAAALAHHGFGQFDRSQPVDIAGTITGLDFVNPHSYLHLDVTDASGQTRAMRCEMRAATLLRRSGWSPDMFTVGAKATVHGFRHRDDPGACYLEDIEIEGGRDFNRNDQFETGNGIDLKNRPLRLASGELNISGDWAQEQYVIAVPPSGRGGNLVPKHMKPGIESGELSMSDVPPSGWGPRPVTYTARGKAEADAFDQWSPDDNPRLRCRPTSIIFDWTFDGAVNRITQAGDEIVIEYGLYSFERVIHMNMTAHPAGLEPSYAGHSIGHWEGDVLVVDTTGFAPGVIAPPIRNSDQLHVVERFTLDPQTLELRRDFVAEDPVYFSDRYVGYDIVLPADVPWVAHACEELAPEFIREPR